MARFMAYMFLGVFLLLPGLHVSAQEKSTPIFIEADRMESSQKANAVEFSGRVEAKKDKLVIHADQMTVHYQETPGGEKAKEIQNQKVSKIFAKGNIEISKEGWIASGDALEFYESENKVILIGNTKVWQDNNMVTGERIVLYLEEGKSVIERSEKEGERVKAFFYPDKEK